jgi:hypothetical protein
LLNGRKTHSIALYSLLVYGLHIVKRTKPCSVLCMFTNCNLAFQQNMTKLQHFFATCTLDTDSNPILQRRFDETPDIAISNLSGCAITGAQRTGKSSLLFQYVLYNLITLKICVQYRKRRRGRKCRFYLYKTNVNTSI